MPSPSGTHDSPRTFELAGWKAVLAAAANIAGFIVVIALPDAALGVSVITVVCTAIALWPLDKLLAHHGPSSSALALVVVGSVAWTILEALELRDPPQYGTLVAVGGPLVGGLWLGGLCAIHARVLPRGARLFAGLLFASTICMLPIQLAELRISFQDERLGEFAASTLFIVTLSAITAWLTQTSMFFVLARMYFRVKPEHFARVPLAETPQTP